MSRSKLFNAGIVRRYWLQIGRPRIEDIMPTTSTCNSRESRKIRIRVRLFYFLQQYANAKGLIVDTIVRDYGSGLDYNRKKWNRLLDAVMENQVRMILVSHRDRFVRFGFDWFERFCKKFNVEIVVVKNEKLSPQEELVQDIVSILHVFSCRLYGLRKYKKQIEGDEELAEGIQDRAPSHRTAEG
jgi:putative resolvase